MNIRFSSSPAEVKGMDTAALRNHFLIGALMKADEVTLTYTHYDRLIVGGIAATHKTTPLHVEAELRADYFLERRELGIINVGSKGLVTADGVSYELDKLDALYLGKGTKEVTFKAADGSAPAYFYLISAPAHHTYPNRKMTKEEASPVNLGDVATANKRTIYKYIHLEGIQSCQLVMGLTTLEDGSVWNSVPPHTHTRRTEVYFYFDVPTEHRVFHFMGEPTETRHLVMANHEAAISPPWSVHFGSGTANYGFIWAMAGENLVFSDMDPAPVASLL
jgi:4-deoxy-L-threo-5-hexosulose-uronate ketol-isomerase